MIYVTGDTHGNFDRFSPAITPGEDKWTENDYLVILGDCGLIMHHKLEIFMSQLEKEKQNIAFLEAKRYSILFIPGNHENYDRLTTEFPEEERFGGTVRRIGRNIFLLQNGEIYNIEGKQIFVFGGAYSQDKAWRLHHDRMILDHYENCPFQHLSWWPEELPSEQDYQRGIDNLLAVDKKVDYVFTHTCPRELIMRMGHTPDPHDLQLVWFLDYVFSDVSFRHWLYGHWHINSAIHPKATALYDKVIEIPDY